MFLFEDLLTDELSTFTYNNLEFTISKVRAVHANLSVIEKVYYSLNLNGCLSLESFKNTVSMDFIKYAYREILEHTYFEGDESETLKFIDNSLNECENIANMLINSNIQLSTKFDEFTHPQMHIFTIGVSEVEKTNAENNKDSDIEKLKKDASKFTGSD